MFEFILIIFVVNVIVIFFIFRAISNFANRLCMIEDGYLSSIGQISKAIEQIKFSMESQSVATNEEFERAFLQNQKSFTTLAKYTKEIVVHLIEIEVLLTKRKEGLEAEIIRLKSILLRKEKRDASK